MNDCGVRCRERIYSVGRGHAPAGAGTFDFVIARALCARGNLCAGTTESVHICLFSLSAAYAVGGGMPPPYSRLSKLSVGRGHVPAGELPKWYKPVRLHRMDCHGLLRKPRNDKSGRLSCHCGERSDAAICFD